MIFNLREKALPKDLLSLPRILETDEKVRRRVGLLNTLTADFTNEDIEESIPHYVDFVKRVVEKDPDPVVLINPPAAFASALEKGLLKAGIVPVYLLSGGERSFRFYYPPEARAVMGSAM